MCRRFFIKAMALSSGRLQRTRHTYRGWTRGPFPGRGRGRRTPFRNRASCNFSVISITVWPKQCQLGTLACKTDGLCPRILPRNLGVHGDEARAQLLQGLLESALQGPSTQLVVQPSELALKDLPPGNWMQLYLLYQATCSASKRPPASQSVFYAVSKRWRCCLRFRTKSAHSMCKICDVLKSKMRHARGFLQHARACDELLQHLQLTWQCRQAYWAARDRAMTTRDVVTIIIDGYDRAKPVLPRWAHGRQPKGGVFDRINRPHLNITCAFAHGYCCIVYLAPESAPAGGSYQWELIFRTLARVAEIARRRGQTVPDTLWLQADNTVKEVKNALSGLLLSVLLQRGILSEGGHHHLPVGHTHEDVGALPAVVILGYVPSVSSKTGSLASSRA